MMIISMMIYKGGKKLKESDHTFLFTLLKVLIIV